MVEIIVKDIIKSDLATDNKQGEVLYKEIKHYIESNNEVLCIDFKELRLLTTAFLNNAIGKIYVEYDIELIKNRILVKNISSENDLELLKLVIINALGIE